jgi:hypothetical protein
MTNQTKASLEAAITHVVVSGNTKSTWVIGAKHQAFGVEGTRVWVGTERGARMLAGKIAKRGGHGWSAYVSPST